MATALHAAAKVAVLVSEQLIALAEEAEEHAEEASRANKAMMRAEASVHAAQVAERLAVMEAKEEKELGVKKKAEQKRRAFAVAPFHPILTPF